MKQTQKQTQGNERAKQPADKPFDLSDCFNPSESRIAKKGRYGLTGTYEGAIYKKGNS